MIKIYENDYVFENPKRVYNTIISVQDIDTLGAAEKFDNPCCLNFASRIHPGGGYQTVLDIPMPIKTQEEDLFRRSNLPELMDNEEIRKHYPLDDIKGIYCDNIHVNKNQTLQIHAPYTISLISVAALISPGYNNPLTKNKTKRILDIAADNNEKTLILGAWGCGAFGNDPEEIATLFKSFLDQDFKNVFENVIFAIPNKNHENFCVFNSVLKS